MLAGLLRVIAAVGGGWALLAWTGSLWGVFAALAFGLALYGGVLAGAIGIGAWVTAGGNMTLRILVVGAGAIGGYFGGRMLAAGEDVTFLVRPGRAAQLAQNGLVLRSQRGDLTLKAPPTVQAGAIAGPFDAVVLSCKAYDLDDAMNSFAPAVGPHTKILPLLNGISHIDRLVERFGESAVLGGQCQISTTLEADGTVRQFGDMQALSLGEAQRSAERDRPGARAGADAGWRPAERGDRAGDVGEMGVHHLHRRHNLPDAQRHRRCGGGGCDGSFAWHCGGVRCHCNPVRLCAPAGDDRTACSAWCPRPARR